MHIRRGLVALAAAGSIAAGLGACSHVQPSLGEWAITTGHGTFSNQDVIHVTGPGQRINIGSGTTSWYVPANTRNYVTSPEGAADAPPDRRQPASVLTQSTGGSDNGLSVHVYTFVNFEVNPAITVKGNNPKHKFPLATAFLQACLKYGCATQHPINTNENSQKLRASDPGWLQWIDEIMPRAIDNATRTAIDKFPSSIWLEQGKWQQVANEISAQLDNELAKLDGSKGVGAADFFCGVGSTTKKCLPMFVQVIPPGIQPVDQGIIVAYRQKQQAQYSLQAAAARVQLAKELYGKDYGWFLGMFDLAQKCPKCTIFAGNAPFHP